MTPLDLAYEQVCSRPSDINQHCVTLRNLASQCEHVTEFGVRYGVSTTAMLHASLHGGRLKKLVSYDLFDSRSAAIKSLAPDVWEFHKANTLDVTIDLTDMLFIDDYHTGRHLLKELYRHADNARRWIVLHDTELFGRRGEHGKIGLTAAVSVYLGRRPEWSIKQHWKHNNGLTLLERSHGGVGNQLHTGGSG